MYFNIPHVNLSSELKIMKPLSDSKVEFIAKTITDLGKAMAAVGFASYFFERFPLIWRIIFCALSVAFIFSGIALYPDKEGGEK